MAILPRFVKGCLGAVAAVGELTEDTAVNTKDSAKKVFESVNNLLDAAVSKTAELKEQAEVSKELFDKDRYKKRLQIEQGLEDSIEFKKLTARVLNCDEEEVTIDKIEATIQEYYDFLDKVKI